MTDSTHDIERFRAMRAALRDAVTPRTERAGLLRRARRVVVGMRHR